MNSSPGADAAASVFLPDRFDTLEAAPASQLQTIIVAVTNALTQIDEIFVDNEAARRGALLILHGESGSGKSTFVSTVGLFRDGISVVKTDKSKSVDAEIASLSTHAIGTRLRLALIDGREALTDTSSSELEKAIHSINAFVRGSKGQRTLVVWLTNTVELRNLLLQLARTLGGEALLAGGTGLLEFKGPPKDDFFEIARRTVQTLNEGASLANLGVSDERAVELATSSRTIGDYLGRLRRDLTTNSSRVARLMGKEQCRVWIVVLAGNDPDADVAALTRGSHSLIDIDRLASATKANIVKDVKRHPDKLGILGYMLDAKIVHISITCALAVMRDFADAALKAEMSGAGMATKGDGSAPASLLASELGLAFQGVPLGTRQRGPGAGKNSVAAFEKLTAIASKKDGLLNSAIGRGLVQCGVIPTFAIEKDLGTGLSRKTDIFCNLPERPIRLELMWRKKSGRADIANYALTKLYNYGRAIGFLEFEEDPSH